MRLCKKCMKTFPLNRRHFRKNRHVCIECERVISREKYRNMPEGAKKIRREVMDKYKSHGKGWAVKLLTRYRYVDKGKHKGFDLDHDWLLKNVKDKPCTYCGDTHNIGLDRIDNSKGHTKDNVVPCCGACNLARNTHFTHEETKILGRAIRKIKAARLTK